MDGFGFLDDGSLNIDQIWAEHGPATAVLPEGSVDSSDPDYWVPVGMRDGPAEIPPAPSPLEERVCSAGHRVDHLDLDEHGFIKDGTFDPGFSGQAYVNEKLEATGFKASCCGSCTPGVPCKSSRVECGSSDGCLPTRATGILHMLSGAGRRLAIGEATVQPTTVDAGQSVLKTTDHRRLIDVGQFRGDEDEHEWWYYWCMLYVHCRPVDFAVVGWFSDHCELFVKPCYSDDWVKIEIQMASSKVIPEDMPPPQIQQYYKNRKPANWPANAVMPWSKVPISIRSDADGEWTHVLRGKTQLVTRLDGPPDVTGEITYVELQPCDLVLGMVEGGPRTTGAELCECILKAFMEYELAGEYHAALANCNSFVKWVEQVCERDFNLPGRATGGGKECRTTYYTPQK